MVCLPSASELRRFTAAVVSGTLIAMHVAAIAGIALGIVITAYLVGIGGKAAYPNEGRAVFG
jgi:hypothetical protein